MTTIGLSANDQLLAVTLSPKVASGQQNTVDIHVEFSDDWDGFVKSAVFFTSNDTNTIFEKVLTNGECVIPAEVMSKDDIPLQANTRLIEAFFIFRHTFYR